MSRPQAALRSATWLLSRAVFELDYPLPGAGRSVGVAEPVRVPRPGVDDLQYRAEPDSEPPARDELGGELDAGGRTGAT